MKDKSIDKSGIYTALITPFLPNGDIDVIALTDLITRQKDSGIHGLILAGTTGECATLSWPEQRDIIKLAKDRCGSMIIVAGAGSNNTKEAIAKQEYIEDLGLVDMTLHIAPYYVKPSPQGLYEHFKAIAHNAKTPIVLYNNPHRTNVELSSALIMRLALEYPVIIGIKDASPDMLKLSELIKFKQNKRPDFLIFSGDDPLNYAYLSLGADGAMAVVSNVAPKAMLALYHAFRKKDLSQAQDIGLKLNELIKALSFFTNPLPIKTLLARLNIIHKSFRLPLYPLSQAEEETFISTCLDWLKKYSS